MTDADRAPLSVERVRELFLEHMTARERMTQVVYIDEMVHRQGDELELGKTKVALSADSIVVFIDEQPGANWGHGCRYAIYDVTSGEVSEVRESFPPSLVDVPGTYRLISKPKNIETWELWSDA